MGRKNKFAPDIKVAVVEDYLNKKRTITDIAKELNVNASSVRKWVLVYKEYGEKGFFEKQTNKSYPKEIKEAAVQDYIHNRGTLTDICLKYDISSHTILRNWVIKYTTNDTIKSYKSKDAVYSGSRKKTDLEKRQKVVDACIKSHYDYKGTAEAHDVSYAQVYQWVKKFEARGIDGLIDNRGKRK